jgi:predicted transcriptional regulator
MIFLTKEQAENRIKSTENLTNIENLVAVEKINSRRTVSKDTKNAAALMYIKENKTASEVAEIFNVNETSVRNYAKGKDGANIDSIEKALSPFRDKAIHKMMTTLNLIKDEEIEKLTPIQQAHTIQSLAIAIEKMSPQLREKNNLNTSSVQLIIAVPPVKNEESYKTITL